jgi:hypothetical protein
MTTYACPKGHQSTTDDFCDTCGAPIAPAAGAGFSAAAPSSIGVPTGSSPAASAPAGSSPAASSPSAASAPGPSSPQAAPGVEICPNCGTPRTGTWRFCEDCGYDHTTGKVPTLEPNPGPAPPTGQWTATVAPDRAYFEANAIEGVEFPADAPTRTVDLPAPQIRIGRKSRSLGANPELDLSAEPADPGVSHAHALLTLGIDGVWLISDLGSTNGTYLNDEPKPLTAGQSRAVADGDRIHVGAWTTITLHAPA